MTCPAFLPSPNPRTSSCRRCGHAESTHPSTLPARDIAYEARFLDEAAKQAERRFGLPTEGFPIGVGRRLDLGQDRYGNSFMLKPAAESALEILEEGWDAGAYSVLEAQKRMVDGSDDAAAWHLFEIAVHAAAIDSHARSLRGGG